MTDENTTQLAINTIRMLSIDAVQEAKSGHPGTPMALAPLIYTIWNRVLRYDPQDPIWPNRDRFVLSNGHASMLLWSILHLTGVYAVDADYERLGELAVTLDDIRRFRQLGSKAPGHPEYRWVSGVETTTGPLGQGVATAVGMSIAQKWLAHRQIKNLLAVTLLSLGVPMLLMGDEARRTQRGNNNAYCQDDEISWFDWNLVRQHAGLHRFVELLAARRALRKMGTERPRLSLNQFLRGASKAWHGVKLHQPDWSQQSNSLAFSAELPEENLSCYILFNAYWESLEFELPAQMRALGHPWRRWIDTSLETPDDIQDWPVAPVVTAQTYRAGPRSVVVLIATADMASANK
jgi:pullulanase/glycogen debranching enzyme